MSQYIPGTFIENTENNVSLCRPPAGKFRVIALDTTSGSFDLFIDKDFFDLEKAKAEAQPMTGSRLMEGSEQTPNKVYVFDSNLMVCAEFGGL